MARKKSRHSEGALRLEKGFFYSLNAGAQPLPEAEATQERTLLAVGCSGLLGDLPDSAMA